MKIILSALLIAVTLYSSAQEDKMDRFVPMSMHTIGGSFQQFDGLNSRVANLPQYKQLKDYTATIGLGWLRQQNRFITSSGIVAGSSMSGNHDEKSSTLRYLAINADLGYDLLKSKKLMLFPFAGIGAQKYQAIFYKDNSAVAFDDVLTSPAVQNNISSVRFNNLFVVYRFGIGFLVQSPKYPSSSIGIRAGYSGSFKRNDWKSSENQTLGGAPTDKISQFFISLVFTNKPMFMMHK